MRALPFFLPATIALFDDSAMTGEIGFEN